MMRRDACRDAHFVCQNCDGSGNHYCPHPGFGGFPPCASRASVFRPILLMY